MHDTITVGLPMLAILFGILLNQRASERLEAGVQAALSEFYRDLGDHRARIALEKRAS
jgi:hypothetical protein